jgi:hypothetical protein
MPRTGTKAEAGASFLRYPPHPPAGMICGDAVKVAHQETLAAEPSGLVLILYATWVLARFDPQWPSLKIAVA